MDDHLKWYYLLQVSIDMLTMDDFNKQENTLIKFCAIIKKPHLKEFQLSQKPGLLKLELTS